MGEGGISWWRALLGDFAESARHDESVAQAYRDVRRRSVGDRVPLVAMLFLFFIGNASLIEARFYPERIAHLVAVCTTELLVCGAAVMLMRWRPSLAWPVAIISSYCLISCMTAYFTVSRGSSEMLGIALILFLAGTAVVYPWGACGQALAGLGTMIAYSVALAIGTRSVLPIVYNLFSLGTAALLMTLGAHLLDQHRWLAFRHAAEMRHLHDLQRQETEFSNALLKFSEVVNATLHDPVETAQRMNEHLCSALGDDFAGTYLLDEARQVFRLVALTGPRSEVWDEILAVELERGAFPLHARLEREGMVEIADRDHQDLIPAMLLQRWHIRSLLLAYITSGRHIIGAIMGGYSQRTGPFSPIQHRMLRGFAQHAAAALVNAHSLETAREANRMKSEFVATISHELRTPLNVVLGYTDLMLDHTLGPLTHEQEDALIRLRVRSLHLLDLIQDILDINRLESGRVPLTIEDFSIGELLQRVRNAVPAGWRQPQVALEFDSANDQVVVRSDRAKVEMIIRNLVQNALKYTEQGSVTVAVASRPAARAVEFVVRDTGTGIPQDELPRIFEMFHQVNGTGRQGGGVGLGLYLVRRLIEALGGSVAVHSVVGQGSEFRISLPLDPAPPVALREVVE